MKGTGPRGPGQWSRRRPATAALVVALVALALACSARSAPEPAPSPEVRLNQIQVLGTHNSYHLPPGQQLMAAIASYSKDLAESIDYRHLPLDQQLGAQGIRQLELDVFADPLGGLFAKPAGRMLLGGGVSPIPELMQPGFKVLHIQDIDFESSCWTFVACLQIVKSWSDANPSHLPVAVLVEVIDDAIPDPFSLGFVTPWKVGAAEMDALDAEIRSVFPAKQLITPDDVRGGRPTLDEAVRNAGWPALSASRGRVMFALVNEGGKRQLYIAGHPALEGRVMFTSSQPGDPDAAFIKLDDALREEQRIRELVSAGYLVRTRADADTIEARKGDTRPRDAAMASGAQFVSTDYPLANAAFGTGYAVSLGNGGPARCNPVNAPPGCLDAELEPAR